MRRLCDQRLISESPEDYASSETQAYIEQEMKRPSKQWIHSVMSGEQEKTEVRLKTDQYMLLPDTERVNRFIPSQTQSIPSQAQTQAPKTQTRVCLNWLAICTEPGLKSLRDLRGRHIPMLKDLLENGLKCIEQEANIPRDEVMAYVHYHPSVYQFHVHFSYPYAQQCHRDVYRIHSLVDIINNLEIDPEFYRKATLQISVSKASPIMLRNPRLDL